jgi:predicted nucleotidyltransferase
VTSTFSSTSPPGASLFTWGGLIGALEDLLGCAVDVAEPPSLKERLRPRVLAEAVPL